MTDLINIKKNAVTVIESPYQPAFTGVRIYVGKNEDNEDLYFAAGSETGSVLEFENPWGTQSMANAVLNTINGYSYHPMQANGALLDPAAEIGDAISANGVYSVIAKRDTIFGALLSSNVSAPGDGELGHEYKYESKQNRQLQREINQANSSLVVELDEIRGQVTDDQGNYTVLTLKSDGLYVGGNSTTLDGDNITDNTIGSAQIKSNAVTSTKIASNSIETGHIKTGAITANEIATGTITANEIAVNTITASEIAAGAINTSELAADAVTAAKIDSEAVRTDNLLVTGMVNFYNSTSKTSYAQLGYGEGNDGSGSATYGAKLVATGGSNFVIVTNAGARMTAGSGNIYTLSSGACWCSQQFQTTSDERVKEDIDDDMSVYKDVLKNLRPVSFRYRPEWSSNQRRQTGFIAQEAEAVIEEQGAGDWGMTSISGDGWHGINYEALIPVLVSCVQDMAKEIAELKEKING